MWFCSQGGVSASVHAGIPHPLEQIPPRADTPQSRHPPSRHPPEQTPPLEQTPPIADPPEQTPPRAGTPPPEQAHTPRSRTPQSRPPSGADTPRPAEHAGRYGQRAGGTYPTGMQSCLSCKYRLYFLTWKDFSNSSHGIKMWWESHCLDCIEETDFSADTFSIWSSLFSFLFVFVSRWIRQKMVYSKPVSFELRLQIRMVDEHMKNSSRTFVRISNRHVNCNCLSAKSPRVQHPVHYLGLQR